MREVLIWRGILAITILYVITMLALTPVPARDLDGRYAQSSLKPWFDGLHSGKGPCCSVADGVVVQNPDWRTHLYHDCNTNNECHSVEHYEVHVGGVWVDVPEDAVITEPNKAGVPMVWPMYQDGKPMIRCFMPGPLT